ncbi:transcriptional regulator [Enterococcus faecalis]|nr:hypothetical protein [Enterococcus faecalis]
MKVFDYFGTVIPPKENTRRIAYVECSCGYLASCLSDESSLYKCSRCKKIYEVTTNREVKYQDK